MEKGIDLRDQILRLYNDFYHGGSMKKTVKPFSFSRAQNIYLQNMPQITSNLRLLFPNSSFFLSSLKPINPLLNFNNKNPIKRTFFTCLSSSSRKPPRKYIPDRKISTLKQSDKTEYSSMKDMDDEVVEIKNIGFNKQRAEGKDKSRKPKDLKLKVRKLNPVNTTSYVQILGTGLDTQDTSPSVLLFFDKQRFIFNAGEGLQRYCTEHKIKLSKIDHIFLSRVCSETAGGLPGLLLTLAGFGDEGISVNAWGPSDFKYLVDAMKSFIPNAAMVHSRSFGPSPKSDKDSLDSCRKLNDQLILIDDEVVKISAILLQPETKDKFASKASDISVLYICELPEIRGKFDLDKARALGLRPGPKYRELQEGNSVKSDLKDIMVHPDDVLGPSVPGPIILLVDCPTSSHFQELLSAPSLETYYADMPEEKRKTVNCVIHLSPSLVVNSSDYQNWMSRFGGAEHIMAGHQMKNIEVPILKSSARVAARLNYLCPQFFPAPGFWSLQQASCLNEDIGLNLCNTTSAENLLKFHLRPVAQLGLDRSGIPPKAGPVDIINDLLEEIPEISDASRQVARLWDGEEDAGEGVTCVEGDNNNMIEEPWLNQNVVPSCLENITREDVEIVLLGTGSSQPSKYRNVSSIFINLFSKGSIMLDCGEGTLGQLKRRYGIEGADDAVRRLKCIWISHIHADHHTGLARILALRRDLLKGTTHAPLIVIAPRNLKRFLDAYERLEDLNMLFLDCRHTTEASLASFESNSDSNELPIENTLFSKGTQMQSHWKRPGSVFDSNVVGPIVDKLKNVLRDSGLDGVISFPVVHCPMSFGVVLKGVDRVDSDGRMIPGWKIVYSGDTRPCPELIEASRGATVLIHEATFEDALVDEAIARNHSTTGEAIEVGNAAGAYRIILTHFSQRYPKVPVFDESHMHKTCIAFDMMSINFADLHVLPKVLPYLKLLFKDEMIVDESDDVEDAVTIAA
ncbi:tRNase Z TRZ3, mitochondrial [Rutidosis leptorrhynchoides]|uniref:tRNase Z TRZ3, mitochondrial n=1 Tax=Rutidosis leptorrhynchoides TaxID=125765 RepID=UPI003A9A5B3B